MDASRGGSRAVRVALIAAQGMFTVAGIALVAVAIWQNHHTAVGRGYWPFMDLFWVLVLGCALIVAALHTIVWLRMLNQSQSKRSLLVAFVVLAVVSPGATVILAVIALLVAAGIPV